MMRSCLSPATVIVPYVFPAEIVEVFQVQIMCREAAFVSGGKLQRAVGFVVVPPQFRRETCKLRQDFSGFVGGEVRLHLTLQFAEFLGFERRHLFFEALPRGGVVIQLPLDQPAEDDAGDARNAGAEQRGIQGVH